MIGLDKFATQHQGDILTIQIFKSLKESPAPLNRPLRRCFVTRAIELGIDFKTIASWQGHLLSAAVPS